MERHLRRITPDHYVVQPNGCWVFKGHRSTKGYGHFYLFGKSRLVHRAMYEQKIGPIPTGCHVHHTCGETMCINPEHLEALSPTEHVRRRRTMKLTAESARLIHELRQQGLLYREIAERIGVHTATVSDVLSGRTWNDI